MVESPAPVLEDDILEGYLSKRRSTLSSSGKRSADPGIGSVQDPRVKPEDDSGEVFERSPEEKGGPEGPDPVRYGDWERRGRCSDF